MVIVRIYNKSAKERIIKGVKKARLSSFSMSIILLLCYLKILHNIYDKLTQKSNDIFFNRLLINRYQVETPSLLCRICDSLKITSAATGIADRTTR